MDKARDGGCACGAARYRMSGQPMIVHACHCSDCQRLSGGAFAINAIIEADRVELLSGEVETVDVPTPSGSGQAIARCAGCHVALWSNYGGAGPNVSFVRVGTLDEPHDIAPDIHIYTRAKVPWLILPEDIASVPEFYDPQQVWPPEARTRFEAARG